jgi:hypothetical protein
VGAAVFYSNGVTVMERMEKQNKTGNTKQEIKSRAI